jgi:hypothetical protein
MWVNACDVFNLTFGPEPSCTRSKLAESKSALKAYFPNCTAQRLTLAYGYTSQIATYPPHPGLPSLQGLRNWLGEENLPVLLGACHLLALATHDGSCYISSQQEMLIKCAFPCRCPRQHWKPSSVMVCWQPIRVVVDEASVGSVDSKRQQQEQLGECTQ